MTIQTIIMRSRPWTWRYEAEFWNDWDQLKCLRPHIVTRVTEHVESDIVPYIQQIIDHKDKDGCLSLAYQVPGDGVYLDVRAFEHVSQTWNSRYGKLVPSPKSTNLFDTNHHHPPPSAAVSSQQEQQPEAEEGISLTTAAATATKRDARDFACGSCKNQEKPCIGPVPGERDDRDGTLNVRP